MDPYSYQPMTTCTVGLFEANRFVGNVTIDVKLEGLATLVDSWKKNGRGYGFILDRQNKFLTFPDLNLVKKFGKDQKGNRTEEFLNVSEFADKNPDFLPLAVALDALNQDIKDLSKTQVKRQPLLSQDIARSGHDISLQESELIAAIIDDPLKLKTQKSALIKEVTYDHDLVTKEKSMASIFHVPGSYWKVVIVNPLSEATYVATRFTRMMISFLGFAVLLVAFVAYFFLTMSVIRPLTQTTKSIQEVTLQIARGGDVGLEFSEVAKASKNEIDILTQSFVDMTRQIAFARGAMARQTDELKVLNENLKNEQVKAIQNAKMASLGEMAAGIAHEINNPTAIISGTLAIMLTAISDPDQIKSRIKIIEKSVARITRIVSGLRKFSRTSNHSNKIVLDLRQVIEEALTMTFSKSRTNNTEVTFECEPGLKILFDEIELEQIIINMIINGVDAVKNSEIRWVRLEASVEGMQVKLFIRDSGHGIPAQHRDKIFQPFFTTKPVGEGTGLGLSIVKGLLEANQASIEILNDQEHTTFLLRFPNASEVGLETQVHKAVS